MAKKYITSCQHNHGADANLNCFDNIDDAVNEIHEFFLSYDMELRDGRPYDPDNASFEGDPKGFNCIKGETYNGKVSGFTYKGGDGPMAFIQLKEK